MKRAAETLPTAKPKAGRIIRLARAQHRALLVGLVMALLLAGGVGALLSAGASRAAAPAPVVRYYADGAANALQPSVASARGEAAPPAPVVGGPVAVVAAAQPGAVAAVLPLGAAPSPQTESADALANVPAAVRALKWWTSAADASILQTDASVSPAGLVAIALQTRPIIPARADETLSGARPAAIAPVELTPAPVLAGRAPCVGQTGTLITDTLRSSQLSRPLPVHVWLPPCHDPVAYKYPALYLIQGSAYLLGQWLVHGAPQAAELLIGSGAVEPFIIVMPGSDMWITGQGKYMWSQSGPASWEGVIADELVPMIERKYGAQPNRESRAIGGISRGGYWSLEIGFARPDLFATVGAHSPAISRDILIGEGANFSMLTYAKSLDDVKQLRIWLDAGDGDWARAGMDDLAAQLKARGVRFVRTVGQGGHVDGYWTSRIGDYIAFYSRGWSSSAARAAASDGDVEGGQ